MIPGTGPSASCGQSQLATSLSPRPPPPDISLKPDRVLAGGRTFRLPQALLSAPSQHQIFGSPSPVRTPLPQQYSPFDCAASLPTRQLQLRSANLHIARFAHPAILAGTRPLLPEADFLRAKGYLPQSQTKHCVDIAARAIGGLEGIHRTGVPSAKKLPEQSSRLC